MSPVVDRAAVFAQLAEMIHAAAEEGRGVGVLLVRLDNLRQVMLDRGYAASAALLAEADARLATVMRRRDWTAQIGDQDFVLLLPGIVSAGQIVLAVNKLLRTASGPTHIGEDAVPLRFSVGVAICPEHGTAAEVLLHAAEQALASAERSMSPMEIFSPERVSPRTTDWQIEAHFDRALERGEFELHYQPKVDLATGGTVGAEALARWSSRELGAVSPAVFVPIAERSGHIERLTWSAMNSALQLNAEWRAAGLELAVAVNLSAVCLRSADLSERLRSALMLWNVPASAFTLEVTETAAMDDPVHSFTVLRAIRDLGVHVSIDDFGTGHSSLSYFRTLPADEIKIDRSFVMNLTTSAADRHLVQSVIDLAHRFDLAVVAEGIEDAQTAAVLRSMGCNLGQGYFFARPLPPQEFAAKIAAASFGRMS